MPARLPTAMTRRSLLGLGAAGLTFALTGCGLRLDQDPDLPELSPTDELRNRFVRILAGIQAQGDEQTAVTEFLTALGPEWTPPPELSTASPESEPQRTFAEALAEIAADLSDAIDSLTGPTAGVLVDVAVGALVSLSFPSDLTARFRELTAESDEAQGSLDSEAGESGMSGDDSATIPDHPLAAFMTAAFQASYGYEQLAVHVPDDTSYGSFVRDRVEQLAIAAEASGRMLSSMEGQVIPADKAGWKLDPAPRDEDSARTLAVAIEDRIAEPLGEFFASANSPEFIAYRSDAQLIEARRFVTRHLVQSAQARASAGHPQNLRFSTTEPPEDQ